MSPNKDIGPDLTIRPGQIGELIIESLVEDVSKTGYTAVVCGGGILSLRLTPQGQRARRAVDTTPLSEETRAAVMRVLEAWGNAKGKAFQRTLRHHAEKLGVPFRDLETTCFINPGRTPPPLREAYERMGSRRRDTFNATRDRRRRTP